MEYGWIDSHAHLMDESLLIEIDEVINNEAKISFLGEFVNNKFYLNMLFFPVSIFLVLFLSLDLF